jgi:hypothetical protein
MNSQFVCEYLTRYEDLNLRSYNSGGYAYETAKIANLEDTREASGSIIDNIVGAFIEPVTLEEH